MKKRIIIICIIILLVIALAAVLFLSFKNRNGSVSVPTPEPQTPTSTFELAGDSELGNTITMQDGSRTIHLEQGYVITDGESSTSVNLSSIKSVQVKYPGSNDFSPADFGGQDTQFGKGEAMFYFPIWPSATHGMYLFRIEYEDGTVSEKTIFWDQPKEITAQKTEAKDSVKGTSYKLGDLDPISFEEMYYINPSGIGIKIENTGDKNFWLKDSDAVPGEHTVLVKKEGVWYVAEITIGG